MAAGWPVRCVPFAGVYCTRDRRTDFCVLSVLAHAIVVTLYHIKRHAKRRAPAAPDRQCDGSPFRICAVHSLAPVQTLPVLHPTMVILVKTNTQRMSAQYLVVIILQLFYVLSSPRSVIASTWEKQACSPQTLNFFRWALGLALQDARSRGAYFVRAILSGFFLFGFVRQ